MRNCFLKLSLELHVSLSRHTARADLYPNSEGCFMRITFTFSTKYSLLQFTYILLNLVPFNTRPISNVWSRGLTIIIMSIPHQFNHHPFSKFKYALYLACCPQFESQPCYPCHPHKKKGVVSVHNY